MRLDLWIMMSTMLSFRGCVGFAPLCLKRGVGKTTGKHLLRRARMTTATTTLPPPPPKKKAQDLDALEWSRLGLGSTAVSALSEQLQEVRRPTDIQKLAIPAILGEEDVVFAAETGSGKTLGYLLPIIDMLKAEEALEGEDRVEKRPRAVILVPTRELGAQVLAVAKALSKVARLSCRGIVGGSDGVGKQRKSLAGSSVDIVVASPGRFTKLWKQRDLYVSRVSHVVIDEVDTMLTQGFGNDLRDILRATMIPTTAVSSAEEKKKKKKRDRAQLVVTTATLTKAVKKALFPPPPSSSSKTPTEKDDPKEWRFLPTLRLLETGSLHRPVATLDRRTVDVSGKDKVLVLADVLEEASRSRKTIIFCNTIASCRAVDFAVREEEVRYGDHKVLCYHGDMNSRDREASLLEFRGADTGILVCTDLAARGLDLPQVDHVVNFDFPRNPIDFLHRVGRTARAGNSGTVTSLVTKKDRVLAAAIDKAVNDGRPIDQLSSSKIDYEPGRRLGPPAKEDSGGKKQQQQQRGRPGKNKVFTTGPRRSNPKSSSRRSSASTSRRSPPSSSSRPPAGGRSC